MIYKNKIEKGLFGWVSKIKDRMYRTITPRGYHIGQAAKEFIKGDTRDMSKFTPLENEVWARYLGTKYEGPSNLEPAIYRPTKGGATYNDVVKLKDESLILSDNVLKLLLDNYKKTGKKSMLVKGNESGLGTYTISMGEDEKGKYISYYDDWDINPTRGISAKYNIPILNLIGDIVPGTHPFSVYGRRYYKNGGKMNAIEQFKEGHKIHIKKKNRGKFTAYCGGNVTSACIAKAKASGNPTLVKRATFAANARKWKHKEGGIIKAETGLSTNSFIDPMIVDYIKAIENPNRVGWNGKIWKAPEIKGYDLNLRGYGIDINTNNAARKLTAGRKGQWLTDDEANTLMLDHIRYITNAANKHIKGFGELPIKRKAALLGMLYRGDSVNKSNINIAEPDDTKFFNSVHNYYISKGLKERANNSSKFFKSYENSNNTIPNFNFNNYKDLNYPFKYIK